MSVHTRKNLHKWYAGIFNFGDFELDTTILLYPRPGSREFPDFPRFACNFNGLVLGAQWELDHELGHFWYLLILKRSFLAMVAVPSDSRRPKSCLEVGGILRLIELIFEFGVSIENPQNLKIHVRFVEKTLKKISTEKTAKNEQNPSRNGGFTAVLRLSPKWRFWNTFFATT